MRTWQQRHRPLREQVSKCETVLAGAGHRVLARVRESERAFDLALISPNGARAVIRCVGQTKPSDRVALKTMLAQGDFDRAALVYAVSDQPHAFDEIETYPLSRIDDLAASLAMEGGSR